MRFDPMTDSDATSVLLVEDNPADARLIEIALSDGPSSDFALLRADRLSVAMDILGEGRVGAVLLDLNLPDSNGLDTVGAVMARRPRLPVVVLTGMNDEAVGIEAVRRGVQDYLVKGSIDGPTVRRALHYAIDRQNTFNLLVQQLKFQQTMVDAMPVPVFYVDAVNVIIGSNVRFEKLVGRSRSDLLGQSVFEALPESLTRHFGVETHRNEEPDVTLPAFDGSTGATRFTLRKSGFCDVDGNPGGFVVVLS